MLRSCRHANIVRYHESFFDQGAVTIVMEYLNRGSLADLFSSCKQLPERLLAVIMTQVLFMCCLFTGHRVGMCSLHPRILCTFC